MLLPPHDEFYNILFLFFHFILIKKLGQYIKYRHYYCILTFINNFIRIVYSIAQLF